MPARNDGCTATSLIIIGFLWILIAFSVSWKRRMTGSGGTSSLAKKLKMEAKKKKQRRRKRLKDFLSDDMLRRQMIKEFESKMGVEECAEHIRELGVEASREVTDDDIQISNASVTKEAMRIIWIVSTAILIHFWLLNILSANVCSQFISALVLHSVDSFLHRTPRSNIIFSYVWWMCWALMQLGVLLIASIIFDDEPTNPYATLLAWAVTSVLVSVGQNYSRGIKGASTVVVDKPSSSRELSIVEL